MIDTHVHFWDPERIKYPWLSSVTSLQRKFVPADFRKAFASAPIEKLVFVECNAHPDQCEQEVSWVESLVRDELRLAAIVAFADLTINDERKRTALLERLLARPMVRAIRHNIQGQPQGFCLQQSFVDGVRTVHQLGGHFELCVKHDQLVDVIELLQRCREGRFMVNHGAKPSIKTNLMQPWKARMSEIARYENVSCKISGLFTEADLSLQTVDAVRPFAEHIAECFGHDRIVYGSDWPVFALAAECSKWVEFVQALTAEWSTEEKKCFYRDNAEEFYRLNS